MRHATVFVIDDDDAVRDALATSLRTGGFAAVPFRSAAEFIDAYRIGGPACLVIDLDLPDVDVLLGVLPTLGASLRVIVTSWRLRRRRLPDQFATCVGLLEKPFGHEELMGLVRTALRPESGRPDT